MSNFARDRRWITVGLIASVIGALVLAALPAAAQDGLPDDEQVLVERAVAAVEIANAYTSYEADKWWRVDESFTAGPIDAPVTGSLSEIEHTAAERLVQTASGPNVQRSVTGSVLFAGFSPAEGFESSTNQAEATFAADVRMVDGQLYIQAAYEGAGAASLPVLPEGWHQATATSFDEWPGLRLLDVAPLLADPQASTSARALGVTPAQLTQIFATTATSASSESITLDDGTPATRISISLGPDSIPMMGAGSGNEAIDVLIRDSVTTDPGLFVFTIDEAGLLRAVDYGFVLGVENLDISSVPDIPADYVLNVESSLQVSWTFTSINQPVEAVAAPDLSAALEIPVSEDLPWWNDRVFYEVFVRSFYDSDGDGIGDLRGLIEKLDYLNDGDPATTDDLGVTGLWLMPVAQSPSYHGYDVTDYYTIEDDYGTNADFLELMAEAHARDMVVIVDLVMNHTSSEHPWFLAARQGDPDYEDFYIWSDDPPTYLGPWGQTVWHRAGDRYFFGLFWEGMPDLNYENPAVTDAMYDVIRFWLEDMGVDGFRLDAIRHLDEDGPVMENTPETLAWLENFHDYVESLHPGALTVGEVWDASAAVAPYIGDKVQIAFEFDLAGAILESARLGTNRPLVRESQVMLRLFPQGQYATFLTNHDQNRVMSVLNNDPGKARAAATVLLTYPGVPFIYYGEEIGMRGMGAHENIRTPMQWDVWASTGGFTMADAPWEPFDASYQAVNVALQEADPASLLNQYRSLVHLRTAHPALRTGALLVVTASDPRVHAFWRYTNDEVLLVVVNLGDEPVSGYTLDSPAGPLSPGMTAALVYGAGELAQPTITGAGGLAGYTPLSELPPQAGTVIAFE